MKHVSLVVAVLATLVAAPAFAAEGNVSGSTLKALGLGGMVSLSDSEGMVVRGMSSNSASGGSSLIAGQLVFNDANGTQFVTASDVNTSRATAENAGLNASSTSNHSQGSGLILTLGPIINLAGLQFQGALSGQAGQTTLPGLAGNGFGQGF